ncbi:MAG: selenoprotein B glycine/betaine/sarcosine/D-proline reductase [Acidimicrobiaceae bacterium]|nr:selenoprotein B glycine/betaine/sarcosine/D-proline reductase [Acidimicrobiaceae bacterium]MEC8120277.1 glycine/sarcosine/betaine reductase selenoprotein B family protein [Actinomycetota bacterium]|tara:strand:- start:87 stop:539 length:453 start_codon:yes stop_codon:yes gene_type:complete
MSDEQLRTTLGGLKSFTFDDVPWTTPKPLHESRVAIVTTAGLRVESNADWNAGDQGFTQIPHDAENLTLAHYSPNFDRVGWVLDKNVVFPIDRLYELAEDGIIGSVAKTHISFMGAQPDHTLETIRLDSGPAAAKLLKDDEVDLVLLTPV